MNIDYIKAKNFFSIGEEPLHIVFKQYGNIVLIKGQNLDIEKDLDSADGEHFSNAAGKSTISECLVYGLYGKTIRNKVSHTEAINVANKKKMEVEVGFTLGGNQYRIVRTRKPDSLHFWENEQEITLGGMPATQKQIEEIIGLNHKAFVNVACFGQHNSYNFLDCDAAEQRSIVESVLALEVYKKYSDTAKEQLKELKRRIKEEIEIYEALRKSEATCENRLAQLNQKQNDWHQDCLEQIESNKKIIALLEMKLQNTDIGSAIKKYEDAQIKLSEIKENISSLEIKKSKVAEGIPPVRSKYDQLRVKNHELSLELKEIQNDIYKIEKKINHSRQQIEKLNNLDEGQKCPHCYGTIDECNYKSVINLNENVIESSKHEVEVLKKQFSAKASEQQTYEQNIAKLKSLVENADSMVVGISSQINQLQMQMSALSKIPCPQGDADSLVLLEKIANAKQNLTAKEESLKSGGPYQEIIISTKEDLSSCSQKCLESKTKINDKERLIPYYEYWVKGFGDDGIRSFIIDGIVTALNARIAYWLKILINGKLKLTFNKKLEACLERNPPNGDPFVYNVTCGGERNRIDLAISQAFAHILMLSSGTRPSLVFLDEVGTNIDRRGIADIYKMICELANEKQVFVITHDPSLLALLQGADVITMKKENGFSTKL